MSEKFIEGVKPFCVGLLIIVGLSVGFFVFTGSVPDGLIVIDPLGDLVPVVAAYATGALCCPGIICIFVEKIRFHVIIALAFVLLLFLSACCVTKALERISYLQTKNDEPVRRMAVIIPNEDDVSQISFRFLDGGKEEGHVDSGAAASALGSVQVGDTCVAEFVEGTFGIDFVTDMYVTRRVRR